MNDFKDDRADITALLNLWSDGDSSAGDALFELIYPDLRRIAGRKLEKEGSEFPLQTRELIHETYLRMVDQKVPWENRKHFFAVASNVIRRVIIDHIRLKMRKKRGGDADKVPITLNHEPSFVGKDWLALDEALTALSTVQPIGIKICELRYFGGLTLEEVAPILGLSKATVKRHWQTARAFLKQILDKGAFGKKGVPKK